MASPTHDDDKQGTIGLPPGAAREMLNEAARQRRSSSSSPALGPRSPGDDDPLLRRPVPAPPASGRGAGPLDRGGPLAVEQDMDILATVPPPGARGRSHEARPIGGAASEEGRAPRLPAEPADAGPRLGSSRARANAPVQPSHMRSVSPSSLCAQPVDELDYGTADLPGGFGRAAHDAQVEQEQDDGMPIGEDTCSAPRPVDPTPLARADEGFFTEAPRNRVEAPRHMTETPQRFPGSDPGRRGPASPARPVTQPGRRERLVPPDGIDRTMAWVRPASAIAGANTRSIVQFFHNSLGRWSDLGEVRREGNVLGRRAFQAWDASPEGLAGEHIRIGFEGDELYVEPLETLNGVYRKLKPNCREPLAPHVSFRIGRHVLEFRPAEPIVEPAPLRSDDGEVFQSRVLAPLGFIDLIGPDRRPYLSFPVTKREERGTRIGRAGVECDIALTGDEWVSLRHARIGFSEGTVWLEDLESTNGTFLRITGRAPLRCGSAQFPSAGDELLVGGYKLRVIAEQA